MYLQCYLHKTSVMAEIILTKILKRATELTEKGVHLWCSDSLHFFLTNHIVKADFNKEALKKFALLDDSDIIGALKNWQFHEDFILSSLSNSIINRNLFHILNVEKNQQDELLDLYRKQINSELQLDMNELDYFVFGGMMKNKAYDKNAEPIRILTKNKQIIDVLQASDQSNLAALSVPVKKYFVCFPKNITLKNIQ